MKKIGKLLIPALALTALHSGVGLSAAHAQLTSGNAVVTATLTDVMALAVVVPAVPLTYLTVEDYQQGKNVPVTGQLLVSCNRNYDIKVKSDGDLQGQLTAAGQTIGINQVKVQATSANLGSTPQLDLSTADQNLVSNATASMAKSIDITYKTAAANAQFVRSGVYTATLTYSIVPH